MGPGAWKSCGAETHPSEAAGCQDFLQNPGPKPQAPSPKPFLQIESSRMFCEVLLFAGLAEAVGKDSVTIELAEGANVTDAVSALCRDHEAIASMRDALAVAVNEQYRPGTTALRDGDTIAIIPPVSGG